MLFFTSQDYTVLIKSPRIPLRTVLWVISLLLVGYLRLSSINGTPKVTISGKGLSLEEVFDTIKEQTGYGFNYDEIIFKNPQYLTVDIKNVDIEDALQICLEGQELSFSIKNKTVTIVTRKRLSRQSGRK
jgi:hypothetical protein